MSAHAANVEELKPLLALCRAGKLFKVQDWIRRGKPVQLATGVISRSKLHNPLFVAMNAGFHSMVEVLLQAGAPTSDRSYVALAHAVEMGRSDLAQLLLQHGASADQVSMCDVLEHGCRPELVDMLLAAGKDLVQDTPIAWGLINCIRPTLGLLKRFVADQPQLMRQVDIALRFHAREGNLKWVALTLWAGGDPLGRGPYLEQDWYDESYRGMNAIEVAALYDRFEVLQQPKMLRAIESAARDGEELLGAACFSSDCRILELLLQHGLSPQRMADQGTEAVERMISGIALDLSLEGLRSGGYARTLNGSSTARNRMAMLHMLVAHGARWLPTKDRISQVRRALLKLAPAYSMEFAWLMKQYDAARRADVRDLLSTPSMRRLLSGERVSLDRILAGIPEELAPTPAGRELRPPQEAMPDQP